jgi:hypothetical protein
MNGQMHLETRPSRDAVHPDPSAVFLDNLVRDAQTQTGPFALALGGEKRIEYA